MDNTQNTNTVRMERSTVSHLFATVVPSGLLDGETKAPEGVKPSFRRRMTAGQAPRFFLSLSLEFPGPSGLPIRGDVIVATLDSLAEIPTAPWMRLRDAEGLDAEEGAPTLRIAPAKAQAGLARVITHADGTVRVDDNGRPILAPSEKLEGEWTEFDVVKYEIETTPPAMAEMILEFPFWVPGGIIDTRGGKAVAAKSLGFSKLTVTRRPFRDAGLTAVAKPRFAAARKPGASPITVTRPPEPGADAGPNLDDVIA